MVCSIPLYDRYKGGEESVEKIPTEVGFKLPPTIYGYGVVDLDKKHQEQPAKHSIRIDTVIMFAF